MNVASRFSIFCDRVMEAGWLMAVIAVPLFFDIYSSRVFEPDKLTLLRSIALIVGAAWVAKQFETGFAGLRGGGTIVSRLRSANPLAIPVLLLVGIYVVATLLSVAQYVSIWGSYQRLQGTYSMLSYITIFTVMLHAVTTRQQLDRLFTVIVLTSLPIAAYGWVQHFRLDPLPWGGDVSERIAANMGNSIFVGAYLIMAMPITLGRWLNVVSQVLRDPPAGEQPNTRSVDDTPYLALAGAYTFILAFQILAIIWTFSRGAWIGGMVGLYVFILIGLTLLRQWVPDRSRLHPWDIVLAIVSGIGFPLAVLVMPVVAWIRRIPVASIFRVTLRWLWLSWIVFAGVGLLSLVAMNVPGTPLSDIKHIQGFGRLAQIFDTEQGTNKVRFLIWEGAAKLVLPHQPIGFDQYTDIFNPIRPLVGYGPEAMYVAYNSFYPSDLAHLEARNASPDRSHNETWDSLVTTGALGFLIYISLFGSVFYNALKWLGFASQPRDRNLFAALCVLGAVAMGVITFLVDKQQLRLLGVALPVGVLGGVLVYLGAQVFFVRQHEGASLSAEDKILIMALLSATIGSFAEIHFGIAIASTRTYFWTYCALLVLIGHRLQQRAPAPLNATARPVPVRAGRRLDAFVSLAKSLTQLPLLAFGANLASAAAIPAPIRFARRRPRRPSSARDGDTDLRELANPPRAAAATLNSGWAATLVHGMLLGVILQVMVFDYINRNLSQSDRFPWIAALCAFTWLVGALVMSAQVKASVNQAPNGVATYFSVLITSAVVAGVYLVLHLASLDRRPANVVESIGFVADVIAWFYVYFFVLLLLLALALMAGTVRPIRLLREPSYLVVYLALAAAAIFGIVTTNLNSIRADIFYKQGLNFDGQRQYDGSLCMYEEAIRLAPDQDFYYLFYGRAFLEKAKSIEDAAPAQPLYNCYPNNAALAYKDPPGISRAGAQRTRLMEAARFFLTRARDLNPLNTDHTANLARMYRTWAELTADSARRNEFLRQSLVFYGQAQLLSPHNAQMLNEYSSALALLGMADESLAKMQESLAVDDGFAQTYVLLGDFHSTRGNTDAAIEAYKSALVLDSELLQVHSALGVLYAQAGRRDLAIQENLLVLAKQPGDFASLRNVALLLRDTGRISEALTFAQRALGVAPEQAKPSIQQLIAQLQAGLGSSGQQPPQGPAQPTPQPTPSR